MKRILITGADSYIGTSFEKWMAQYDVNDFEKSYEIDTVDTRNAEWKKKDFSGYDVVFHVAGIAHVRERKAIKKLYYDVNYKLTVDIAKKAKKEGVKQFIFLSSMSVYGIEDGVINKETIPRPNSYYGKSKLLAEKAILKIASNDFYTAIVRPPMVYGKKCKGNYAKLSKFASMTVIFSAINNYRSMIYIDNLSEFIKYIIDTTSKGVFFPQNKEYVSVNRIIRLIAEEKNRKIYMTKIFNLPIKLLSKKVKIFKKIFGTLIYSKIMSNYDVDYSIVGFEESIKLTES